MKDSSQKHIFSLQSNCNEIYEGKLGIVYRQKQHSDL